MTEPTVDFGPQTRLVAWLAEQVTEEQLGAATPCPDYAVRNLLGHVVGLTVAFRDAARKDFGPTTDTDPGSSMPDVEPDWRGGLPKLLDELAEAWRDPRAWEGMTRAGSVDLPGAVAGAVAMDELVVHGWDLARATGQEYAPDTSSLEAAHSLLAQAAEDPTGGGGLFGPVVPIPPDAPLLDRVIGLSGRDPGWRPA
ncbi:TIGR03086 family metal-binding protein [Streptomyces himalayensis]|uniref:TIGR03086 family protein n=1 Tax=Streptomyces himalayensis subsp. himalayensis TaxID=2756131 RepID=A0A7W0IAQ8_9ACTN|nr:TIGR03086 family metal-binding protein [Streptomyces himalayensis]MBA2948364.1 TIGR03086 family protein [Streptomyces himalayensis subsp. himalayensis]